MSRLARCQPRKRILVEPLFWTRLHLYILSCTFSQCSPARQDMIDVPPIDELGIAKFKRLFYDVRDIWTLETGAIRGILINLKPLPFQCRQDLFLRLGDHRRVCLGCHYYCLGDNIPVAAYIDHGRIKIQRTIRVEPPIRQCKHPAMNHPAINLGKLKLKRITPIEPLHDPYLRALGRLNLQQAAGVTGVTPKLIFSTKDRHYIYIYSANIPSSVIGMFDNPSTKPSAPNHLFVQITSIPLEPVKSLRSRLLAVLLSTTSLEDAEKPEKLIVYANT
ncbi:hypothetical protein L249_8011 [Ophiocordyceps polyrhachis-furcata BCC 54312]|uniref:Uncharacterized protein n=1 Tax=Ophiocordyceps polyrhachis-furcata BCC 54312 TaxID=1330021 RepID=A0A367LI29_9HYPO|nr:hypothetical protein L249_8011 [Ophiocordyceps polyrhachis-furcata BCC 54312]